MKKILPYLQEFLLASVSSLVLCFVFWLFNLHIIGSLGADFGFFIGLYYVTKWVNARFSKA